MKHAFTLLAALLLMPLTMLPAAEPPVATPLSSSISSAGSGQEFDKKTIRVTASAWEQKAHGGVADFPPEATLDGNLKATSSWRADGKGQWIQYDLGSVKRLEEIQIAFLSGDKRQYTLDLLVSKTGAEKDWTMVAEKVRSSGKAADYEPFKLNRAEARFVRIVGQGNTSEKFPNWINITEVAFFEAGTSGVVPQSPKPVKANSSPIENTCVGKGLKAKCFINGFYWNSDNGDGAWAITSPKPGDIRFELRQGDIAQWDKQRAHAAERNEISNSNHKFPLEADIWLSFGLMVDPGPKVSSRWLVIGQLKASDDPGDKPASPPVGEELNAGDEFRITVRTATEKPLKHNPGYKTIYVDPAFERGRVYRMVYRIKYSQKAGHVQVWRDGREIANFNGPVGYVSYTGPYWKFGIYREPAPETIAVHYYDIKIGGSELEPR